MSRSIEVHIDELVLQGILPRDRYAVAAALEAELTRLFAEKGLPSIAAGAGVPMLSGARFHLVNTSADGAVGGQIAGSVYAAFDQLTGKQE